MAILVTGATGNVGRHVVEQLVDAGHDVRAMTRNPDRADMPAGVQVCQGDLGRPDTLRPALHGVDRMHLISVDGTGMLQTAPEIVALAREAGVRRIVVLSGDEDDRAVERAVEDGGVEWTHLRPMEFMANTLEWAESISTEGVVRAPFGNWESAMIHEADIAAVAVTALLHDGHAGRTYTLTGPEPIRRRDAVRILGTAIGREVRFEELTPEQATKLWTERGIYPQETIAWLLELGADPPPEIAVALPTVEQVTGRRPRTFARWAADHASDFAAQASR